MSIFLFYFYPESLPVECRRPTWEGQDRVDWYRRGEGMLCWGQKRDSGQWDGLPILIRSFLGPHCIPLHHGIASKCVMDGQTNEWLKILPFLDLRMQAVNIYIFDIVTCACLIMEIPTAPWLSGAKFIMLNSNRVLLYNAAWKSFQFGSHSPMLVS